MRTGQGLVEAFTWLSETITSRMMHETGVVEKSPVLEKQDEINMIIQEGLRESPKTEIDEKRKQLTGVAILIKE